MIQAALSALYYAFNACVSPCVAMLAVRHTDKVLLLQYRTKGVLRRRLLAMRLIQAFTPWPVQHLLVLNEVLGFRADIFVPNVT